MKNVRTVPPCGASASATAFTKGGLGPEPLPLGRVSLLVPRPRGEARVAEPPQQLVRPGQRVLDQELPLQDPHDVPAAERADAVVRPRAGVQPGHQLRLPPARQPRLAALAAPRLDGVDAAVAVRVRPVLHAAAGAAERRGDVRRLPAAQREQDRPVAVAAERAPLGRRPAFQLGDVAGLSFGNPQSRLLVRGGRIMPAGGRSREGAAREKQNESV